jgi:lysophospholipase L1-like esterase
MWPSLERHTPAVKAVTTRIGESTGIPVIDVYALFSERHEYFFDTNHFNEEGLRRMAKIVYEHIKGFLQL